MAVLDPKRSDETVLYLIDWARELGATADAIRTFTLTVSTGTVTLTEEENLGVAISVLIAGGTDGVTQEIECEIVTVGGQTLYRDLTLLIDDGATAIVPQTTTKRTLVEMAYEECGLAGYEFDTTPEELASGLRRLDALMAQWRGPGTGLALPYNAPAVIGGSDLDDESGIPDFAANGVAVSLALRIEPMMGKTMSPESRVAYSQSLNAIRAACTVIPERILQRSTIRGAGGKPWSTWNPFQGQGTGNG